MSSSLTSSALVVALAPRDQQTRDLEKPKACLPGYESEGEGEEKEVDEATGEDEIAGTDENQEFEDSLTKYLIEFRFDWRARDVWFLTAAGERVIYSQEGKLPNTPALKAQSHDLKDVCYKGSGHRPTWETVQIGEHKYLMPTKSKQEELRDIDTPKLLLIRNQARHPSDLGWNLPVGHPRHMMQLPQEIRDMISQYVLCVDASTTIEPMTVTTNYKRTFTQAHHVHKRNENDTPSLSFRQAWDQHRSYIIVRQIDRPQIDACYLRVNKKFFNHANHYLYSGNTFSFGMVNYHPIRCPPTSYDGKTEYMPHPEKPAEDLVSLGWTEQLSTRVAIALIQSQAPAQQLLGWVYYDPFLRFLHTIGPRNASHLTTLQFNGVAIIHQCNDQRSINCAMTCKEDLVATLKIYVPFINELCPHVTKIIIRSERDLRFHPRSNFIAIPSPTGYGAVLLTEEMALRPFLENGLRAITNLDELVVIDGDNENIPWAKDAIDWFTNRMAERKIQKAAQEIRRREEENAKESRFREYIAARDDKNTQAWEIQVAERRRQEDEADRARTRTRRSARIATRRGRRARFG